jgi:hypothetical protein
MKKKILSISFIALFSIALWISIALSEPYVSTIIIPIEFIDLPNNCSVGFSSNSDIYMQVKASGWELAKLELKKKVSYNVSVYKKIGKHRNNLIDFIDDNPWLTSAFQVIQIAPGQIEYEIEKVGMKHVPISGNIKLDFKPGFGMTSKVRLFPSSIDIYGPQNLLHHIDTINTEYKEFSSINDNISLDLLLKVPDGITIPNKLCTIEFEVQKIVEKVFYGIQVEVRNVPNSKKLVLFPGEINVTLKGGLNKLGKILNDSIKAYVDYWAAIKTEEKTIDPVIEIPEFTEIIAIEPNKLEYVIKQN